MMNWQAKQQPCLKCWVQNINEEIEGISDRKRVVENWLWLPPSHTSLKDACFQVQWTLLSVGPALSHHHISSFFFFFKTKSKFHAEFDNPNLHQHQLYIKSNDKDVYIFYISPPLGLITPLMLQIGPSQLDACKARSVSQVLLHQICKQGRSYYYSIPMIWGCFKFLWIYLKK